jgi:surface protein
MIQLNSIRNIIMQPKFRPFIMTVESDAASDTFTIPTNTALYVYNYTVKTSEGHLLQNQTGNCQITWASEGIKTIEIYGKFPQIRFNNAGDRLKVLSVEQVGNIKWSRFESAFYGCSNMVWNATDAPDLRNVELLFHCFRDCSLFNGEIGNWDVSTIKDMRLFFQNTAFNKDIGSWDVSEVTNMQSMFNGSDFDQDISSWETDNCENMSGMFANTSFNQDIGSWETGSVKNMSSMFDGNTAFNQDIGGWDTSKVTTMRRMFTGVSDFDQDIGSWQTGNVTDMYEMFINATSFDQDISSWDTSKVTDMMRMLRNTPFNQDISGWDVSKVTTMREMLRDATAFKQDIASWDIANVGNFASFLLNIDINNPNSTDNQVNYNSLLEGWANRPTYSISKFESHDGGAKTKITTAGHSLVNGNKCSITGTTNYDSALSAYTVSEVDGDTFVIDTAFVADDATGTVQKDLQTGLSFQGGNSKASGDGITARTKLVDDYDWTIIDGDTI